MQGTVIYPSPVGDILIRYDGEFVTELKPADAGAINGEATPLTETVFKQLNEYFGGARKTFDFRYKLNGTPFQKKVWGELCKIPYGETRSYKDIAAAIGCPKAYRAVGAANRSNPIFIIIPCHRVIGANGALTGYGGGLKMKQALLNLEEKHIK